VIASGDLFQMTTYPFIDVEQGGTINGIIEGANRMLDLVIPEFRMEGGTMIVPGHGRLSDGSDLAYYRDMLTIIRDRMGEMVRNKMTLQQVKAAHPTLEYDGLYGDRPEWTGEMFVEAVYRDLSKSR
jgi:cyclase